MYKPFSYKLKKHIAVLGLCPDNASQIEVNIIRYNEGHLKLDIRKWTKDDEHKMLKGITLGKDEAEKLKQALDEINIQNELD